MKVGLHHKFLLGLNIERNGELFKNLAQKRHVKILIYRLIVIKLKLARLKAERVTSQAVKKLMLESN